MKTKEIDDVMNRIVEYDRAAEWYAKHGELPANMGIPGAITEINEDPEAFMDRVKDFKYALAMNALNLPEVNP